LSVKVEVAGRVARFFLVHGTKTGKNVPNEHKMYQMAIQYPIICKIFQIAIKYIIFKPKDLQNLPKLGFFGLKRNHQATLVAALATFKQEYLVPILPNTILLILHIFVRFSQKYVCIFLQICETLIPPKFYKYW
jgi:hypothetical protein